MKKNVVKFTSGHGETTWKLLDRDVRCKYEKMLLNNSVLFFRLSLFSVANSIWIKVGQLLKIYIANQKPMLLDFLQNLKWFRISSYNESKIATMKNKWNSKVLLPAHVETELTFQYTQIFLSFKRAWIPQFMIAALFNFLSFRYHEIKNYHCRGCIFVYYETRPLLFIIKVYKRIDKTSQLKNKAWVCQIG